MDLFSNDEIGLPFEMPREQGYSVEWSEKLQGYKIFVPNGELVYVEQFFEERISDRSVEYFQENDSVDWREIRWRELSENDFLRIKFKNIEWKQDRIKLYGRDIRLPRLTSWYGDSGKVYIYSGIKSEANEWNKGLLFLKEKIEQVTEIEFNSVLLNWYRDGEDSLSWHSDNERELGINPIIASANFGETRDFVMRRKDDPSKKLILPLKHGTLLLMRGELQSFWEHCVPKRKNVKGSRFNLTFRRIGM